MKKSELREIIQESLFEILTEALCAKGKAYVAKRKAAGEKHGAYLMGRAVKVCKGQIKGETEDAAMKKSALGMAMYGKKAKMNEQDGQVNVFGYQTKHYDICPGAQSLYKAIVDGEHGKQDKDLVIRVAKLHDSLFYMEKLAKNGQIEVTSDLVDMAQNTADLIMSAAKEKMNLEKEHSYVQGHVDTIKDLVTKENALEIEEIDALHENEEYCPKCAAKIKEAIREEVKKVAKEAKTKPAKGKRFAKKVKNPKTEVESDVLIEGLESFLA